MDFRLKLRREIEATENLLDKWVQILNESVEKQDLEKVEVASKHVKTLALDMRFLKAVEEDNSKKKNKLAA